MLPYIKKDVHTLESNLNCQTAWFNICTITFSFTLPLSSHKTWKLLSKGWIGIMTIVHDKLIFLPGSALPNGHLSDGKQSDEEEKFRVHLSYSEVWRFVLESVTQVVIALLASVLSRSWIIPITGEEKLSNSNSSVKRKRRFLLLLWVIVYICVCWSYLFGAVWWGLYNDVQTTCYFTQ